jgi:hypothetical protein
VTRVILRDATRSEEEFLALARHLGMHGITYFIGWGSWLDIAPDGGEQGNRASRGGSRLRSSGSRRPCLR